MSTCISREGEYGEHQIPAEGHPFLEREFWPWVCGRCGVLDEDALLAAAACLAALRTLAREWATADTTHRDDFLRGHATGMCDAGRALLERLGDNEGGDHV